MTWPRELIAVRHGESVANAAFAAAHGPDRDDVRVDGPDWAVALTDLGRRQAVRLGGHLATLGDRIDVVFTSTYQRARETTSLALGELCRLTTQAPPILTDERLRDRELGILELRSRAEIARDLPDEVARRGQLGEFYYRPPAGESFPDVIARVRAFVGDLRQSWQGKRVLVVGHDAVVLMLRYVIEGMTPEQVMVAEPVRNAGITRWSASRRGVRLAGYNETSHLDDLDLEPEKADPNPEIVTI
jgi:broad specificity phosphatase PhoE